MKLRRSSVPFVLLIVTFALCSLSLWQSELLAQAARTAPAMQRKALGMFTFTMGLIMLGLVMVIVGIAALGLQIWGRILLGNRYDSALRALADYSRTRLFLLGLVNLALPLILVAVFGRLGVTSAGVVRIAAKLLLLCFMALLMFLAALGFGVQSERLGRKILSLEGGKDSPIRSIALGWLIIYPLILVPILGWAILIYLMASGCGAVVMSMFSAGRSETSA